MKVLEMEKDPQPFTSLAVGNKIVFILSSDLIVSNTLVQSKQAHSPKITKPRILLFYNLKIQCEFLQK